MFYAMICVPPHGNFQQFLRFHNGKSTEYRIWEFFFRLLEKVKSTFARAVFYSNLFFLQKSGPSGIDLLISLGPAECANLR